MNLFILPLQKVRSAHHAFGSMVSMLLRTFVNPISIISWQAVCWFGGEVMHASLTKFNQLFAMFPCVPCMKSWVAWSKATQWGHVSETGGGVPAATNAIKPAPIFIFVFKKRLFSKIEIKWIIMVLLYERLWAEDIKSVLIGCGMGVDNKYSADFRQGSL